MQWGGTGAGKGGFFGRPRNIVAPSIIYFSIPVIMEQSKLPTALKSSLLWLPPSAATQLLPGTS